MSIQGVGGVVRPLFRALAIPASGLSAQRARIDVIAQNIANAETTRTPEGGPYQRRVVELAPRRVAGDAPPQIVAGEIVPGVRAGEIPVPGQPQEAAVGVAVEGVATDGTEGPLVYDPGHPDADENGYVRHSNVRITDELVDMMQARRMYEANASVFEAIKGMLKRATEI